MIRIVEPFRVFLAPEVIEFSPASEYDQTMAVVAKNLEAAGE